MSAEPSHDAASWISFSNEEIDTLIKILSRDERGSQLIQRINEATHPDTKCPEYRARAAELSFVSDGTCEIDSEAVVSHSDDNGAYVMAWVWVEGTETHDEENEVEDADLTS